MKNTLIRAFVLVLVVSGFSASSLSASAKKTMVVNGTGKMILSSPTPLCPLHDPKGCGID